MSDVRPAVFVVDDDPSVRDAIGNLLESHGLRAELFASTEEFRRASRPDVPSCLVLDVKLPGMSGPKFQESMASAGISIPVIFITAYADVPTTSRAMKAGAIEFLMKPFQTEDLLAAIHEGLDRDRLRREQLAEMGTLRSRYEELTFREREVLTLVTAGLTNKEVAVELGLSEVTVKMHRGRTMQKMQAASLAELVRIYDKLQLQPRR